MRRVYRIGRTLRRFWRMAKDPDTSPLVRFLIYGAMIYLISPLDFLPDTIPILGVADDITVVTTLLTLAISLIPRQVKERTS